MLAEMLTPSGPYVVPAMDIVWVVIGGVFMMIGAALMIAGKK